MKLHKSTSRDYVRRVIEHDKAESAEIAIKFGQEYWDGERHLGYGGYSYDGRWRSVAQAMVDHYQLRPGSRILDVGCGKGFLLYEFAQVLEGVEVAGIDISDYAIRHAKEEVKPFLKAGTATSVPYPDHHFDYVVSVNTLHNLYNYELWDALREIERVGKGAKHIVIESYRNEREKANLLYWQLTCRTFWSPPEWEWFFKQAGYTGDYSCIYFE
jgi:protein-L-isoaspartate(D-aspartate) O-methyltransferase